jgi:hypothetical protein
MKKRKREKLAIKALKKLQRDISKYADAELKIIDGSVFINLHSKLNNNYEPIKGKSEKN